MALFCIFLSKHDQDNWPHFLSTIWTVSRAYSRSKNIHAIFQKEGKNLLKKGKIFENLGKNVQNSKIFWKRAGDYVQLSQAINC